MRIQLLLLAGISLTWSGQLPASAPVTSTPFAETALTLEQINAASPFFTVDGRQVTPLASVPARLEDLQVLRLWPGNAPLQSGSDLASDVPALTVFLPARGKATGSAVIVFPGGGYSHLSPREGLPAARWLAINGVTAFILKSRLGARYHHPAEMLDAQRAIRYVRANAPAWGLDPKRIGIIGFSAGGHLASTVATRFDAGDPAAADVIERVSSRPDLQILLYPVVTFVDETIVHKGSRTMLVGNDAPPETLEFLSAENSDAYVAALGRQDIPLVYIRAPIGNHGFGITDDWSGAAMAWLRSRKF